MEKLAMPHVIYNHTITPVNTIYCIGRSYAEHAHELGNHIPDEPLVFIKPNSSITLSQTLVLPKFSNNVHYETELVLLIGDDKKIIGHTVGLDLTARDVQDVCKQKGLPWLKAKGFKGACWLGAFVSFINNSHHLSLSINGEIRQHDSTDNMMYSFEYLVDYLDELYGLQKGDIIMTGTPKGVGKLTHGDMLQVCVDDVRYDLVVN